jgi:hypothetical protein
MNKITTLLTLILVPLFLIAKPGTSYEETLKVANYLQDISVTIRSEGSYSKSEGSGVLITRKIGDEVVTFVWTCGHVVDNLRTVRTVIEEGAPVKLVEFDDVRIIKELVEGGRRVGEINMDATVIKYSDADDGEDLALLMVRAKDYGKASAKFDILGGDKNIIPIGTELFHVGSLLGQMGANSMTAGIISQVGRIHGKVEFDQTTVTAFPGSSGGGVYLKDGTYVGMIVRGAGEGFNLMVPIRRMVRWAKKHDIMWALDASLEAPAVDEILELPVESTKKKTDDDTGGKKKKTHRQKEFDRSFPYLIKTMELTDSETINLHTRELDHNPAPLKFR